ncbi:Abortive infection bacteriophage resistance protein [Propionibacterium freudenreichii]|nr:Abortive infection bacteriophage resistance protein [Propionibacterium freudenreichii]SCQ47957.1 Abortive infection bacteriophage resistance protein [Propionibacterium freudenreichii]SCQ51851.1 Abortive infection bacteriophage resistance protein [Propionibacterium freudenreichii]
MHVTTLNSTYAKPFLTVPEQIRQLRGRGMDCGDDAYAAEVLQRYGYYRLSGYWHLYRDRPVPPAPRFDGEGREIRLETFVAGTRLVQVVSLYEFDHELRMRLGDVLSTVETAFRFFIGHRLGRVDAFAHRHPWALGATRQEDPSAPPEPTTAHREWLEEYDRHEQRARGDFVVHFRQQYGPHLPIWVATEVMSFGVLSSLYDLMLQSDQEILAARFQVRTADGRGDRGALGNWLNDLRNVRNICAHYGRLWNRAFDVTIDAPGQARQDADDLLAPLADDGTNNRLYGMLLVLRHLMLSIAPEKDDVVDLADFIEGKSRTVGFGMEQLGLPDGWRSSPIWDRAFALDRLPMVAASLLDRAECMTAAETRASLTGAEVIDEKRIRTPAQAARAKKAAQGSLLRTYLKHDVVIEVELGGTKFYPAFQFRDGKIVDALAEINQALARSCGGSDLTDVARALLNWWQTPHPDLPQDVDGSDRSPLDLLGSVTEEEFAAVIDESDARGSFAVSDLG